MKLRLYLAVVLLVFVQSAVNAAPSAATTLPLVNGDFETGPFDTLGTVTGWTVSGNGKVLSSTQGATSGTHSAALGAVGNSQGNVLSQSFVSIPGRIYSLDFDTGVMGVNFDSPMQLHVQLIGNSSLIDQTLTPYYAGTNNPDRVIFVHYHYTFTADSTATTLQFTDISASNAGADMEVDSVSVALHVASGPATYTAKDLGSLSGSSTGGYAINIYGQVAGYAANNHVFLSAPNGGPLADLGQPGPQVRVNGVNRVGQIVGYFTSATGRSHGFLSGPNGGGFTDLGGLDSSTVYTQGLGVNDSGQVTGFSVTPGNNAHAILSGPDGVPLMDLGTLNNHVQSSGLGINAAGQVCGNGVVNDATFESHAFLSGPNGGPLEDIGTLGGTFGQGTAVNDSGQVAGVAYTAGGGSTSHAFRSGPNGTNLTDISLGIDRIFVNGMNSCGQVIGRMDLPASIHGYICNLTGGVTDLNALLSPHTGATIEVAYGINDQGQIAASGTNSSRLQTAFLLRPNLSIEATGPTAITLFWPGSSAGPKVQRATTLGPGADWEEETTQPDVVDGAYLFTVTPSQENFRGFYRLTFSTGSESQQQVAIRPNQRTTGRAELKPQKRLIPK